ncbi:MAG TPA: aminoacyl-tRNA hydrolase [Bacilli bacterium]|nr:aminoacyl-tRNA hydrolase [Bacilli bacterium]HPS18863.1 aminoacyl-tRNA hydrolase [Bacilli bacterium]
MKLIVGLGNPGKKYEKTRHNMGFMTIDLLSELSKIDVDKEVFHGLLGRGNILGEDVYLFKPTTFMNLSGLAVSELVSYFKIGYEDIIIIFDDMALAPGQIRLRKGGSSGGHKGMQNIIDALKTEDLKRIRIGIGEPEQSDTIDYVLGKPLKDEQPLIAGAIESSVEAIKMMIKKGFDFAMNNFNRGDKNLIGSI